MIWFMTFMREGFMSSIVRNVSGRVGTDDDLSGAQREPFNEYVR